MDDTKKHFLRNDASGRRGKMRKADIANEIFKQVGVSKNDAADIVELVLNLLKGVLQKVMRSDCGIEICARSKGPKGRILEPVKKSELLPVEWSAARPSQVFKST